MHGSWTPTKKNVRSWAGIGCHSRRISLDWVRSSSKDIRLDMVLRKTCEARTGGFCVTRLELWLVIWRREWDSNPRGRDAQRLSCQPTIIRMGSRGRRFNHSAIPAQQRTKTRRVLNHSSHWQNHLVNASWKEPCSEHMGVVPQGSDLHAELS